MIAIDRALQLLVLCPEHRQGLTAIDGGAFRGSALQHLLASGLFAQILAYEPDPESYYSLCENISQDQRVKLSNFALGESNTFLPFYRGDFPATNSLLPRPQNEFAPYYPVKAVHRQTLDVRVVSLDKEIEKHGLDKINFIKLDLQGGELAALRGTKDALEMGAVDVIVCEVVFIRKYDNQPLYHEIATYLAQFGYSLYAIDDLKLGDYDSNEEDLRAGQWNQADAIFLSPQIRAMLDRI